MSVWAVVAQIVSVLVSGSFRRLLAAVLGIIESLEGQEEVTKQDKQALAELELERLALQQGIDYSESLGRLAIAAGLLALRPSRARGLIPEDGAWVEIERKKEA